MQDTSELEDSSGPTEPLSAAELQQLVINSLEDDKAEDIINIDLTGKTSIADSMIIASGRSTRQVAAIADHLYRKLKHATADGCKLEGMEKAGMIPSGINPDSGLVEIVELKDHPWFVGVQFHPELKSTVEKPHPLFVSFVKACLERKYETSTPVRQ